MNCCRRITGEITAVMKKSRRICVRPGQEALSHERLAEDNETRFLLSTKVNSAIPIKETPEQTIQKESRQLI